MTNAERESAIMVQASIYFASSKILPDLRAKAESINADLRPLLGTKTPLTLGEYEGHKQRIERLEHDWREANNEASACEVRMKTALIKINTLIPGVGITFKIGQFQVRKYTSNDQDRIQLWETPEAEPVDDYA